MLKLLLRILLLFFYSTSCVANISKRSRQSCSYSHTIKNGIQKIIFARKEWQTMDKEKGIELFFNPCEYLDESLCGKNKSVCIQNARDHSILVHGEHFQLDEERNLNISLSRSDCKLTIIPECQENMQEQPQLIRRNKCEFEVKMMSSDCDPIKCSLKHRGEEIDMQPLNQKHIVKSNNKTFSIVLCNTNPDCGIQGVTSCDITDSNNIIPLSSRNREFRYDENTNEIIQHGTFKGRENQRKFELKIKCDWDIKTSEIRYKEVPIQGKYYKFEMKSRHACFRVTPQCEIFYKYYFYDFTTLHRDTYWKVDNLPNDLEMLLSICGKQRKPPFGSGNNCSSSFSQACHKSAEGYKNMGSIQTKFNIQNEIITTTIIRGDTCKNNKKNEQNSTHIEFRCSKTEENPTFLRYDNCSVSLIWNTPAACPKNNKDSCESIRPVASNTTVVTAYNIYNLSSLQAKNGNHILKDEENTSLQYELNIGAPVVDDDAPCKKDMMIALKDLSEYNVRHKVKSFGQMKQAYENDKHQLVIETVGGDLCPQQQIYYKGKIVLECCDNETCKEDLSILNKTDCTVTFLWKTRAVCSEEKTSTCVFKHPFHDRFLFDFNQIKQSYLEIKDDNTTYLFDMCQNNESKCTESDCTYVAVDKSLMTHGNKTHLEFSMNKTCSKDNKFNKTVFELVCDEILNNDHFVLKGLKNCILTFQLKTHVACFDKELVIDVSKIEAKNQSINPIQQNSTDKKIVKIQTNGNDIARQKEHYDVDVDQPQKTKPVGKPEIQPILHESVAGNLQQNCSVLNPNTGYCFNISSLKLNVSSRVCPKIVFSDVDKSVTLQYSLNKICGNSMVFIYNVIMKCPSDAILKNTTEKGDCYEKLTIEVPETCKLLEKAIINGSRFSTGTVAGITVGTLALTLLFIGIAILGFLKFRSMRRKSAYTYVNYEKDVNL